jgi:DNA-binding NarL/FixJ family response regulator
MERIRILLVDDEEDFLTRLQMRFEHVADFELVGKARDGREALALAEERSPDVIVLDLMLPEGPDGVEVVRRLNVQGCNARILAVSNDASESYIYRLLDEGASGYLLKNETLDTIADGVRGVFHGEECWFSPRMKAKLALRQASAPSPKSANPLPKLGPQEERILEYLTRGHSNWKIHRLMGIAQNTVRNHLTHIYQKLCVDGRCEAQAWAWEHGYGDKSQRSGSNPPAPEGPIGAGPLEGGLAQLAALLEGRRIPYLLAGDVAVPRSAGSTAGEDIALVIPRHSLEQVPEIDVGGHDRDWTRARFGYLRIDLLLLGDSILTMLLKDHAAILSLGGHDVRCVSVEGQILLKLLMLPRLYKEAHFPRIALWESDIASLLFDHQSEAPQLLEKLLPHLSSAEIDLVSQILNQIQTRIGWFRSSGGTRGSSVG